MEIRTFGKKKIKQSNISWRRKTSPTDNNNKNHHIIETVVRVFKHWTSFFSCNTAAIYNLYDLSSSYVAKFLLQFFWKLHSVTHPSFSLLKCKIDLQLQFLKPVCFKLIFPVLVKKRDQKQHPTVLTPPLSGVSLTRSLTHSSLKDFPLEFIFLVKRWVVVLIKLFQYWIEVLDSLMSIWKPNGDSISWLNWRARERERVLGTVFLFVFFFPHQGVLPSLILFCIISVRRLLFCASVRRSQRQLLKVLIVVSCLGYSYLNSTSFINWVFIPQLLWIGFFPVWSQ